MITMSINEQKATFNLTTTHLYSLLLATSSPLKLLDVLSYLYILALG